jgi:hypothetical protein
MPRPGGNPKINQNPQTFSTDRKEPLTALVQLRVSERMKAELKAIPDWQEFVRNLIEQGLQERSHPAGDEAQPQQEHPKTD